MKKEGEDKIFNIKRKWNIPKSRNILKIISSFSMTEKIIFHFLIGVLIISSAIMLWKVNRAFLIEFPAYGGYLKEGIVGSPRFINPILAISDADRDMTSLIYSGLMKSDPNGNLIPDLAESYNISKDGLVYTFKLKDEIYFHDGEKVTSDDVEFTIKKTLDSTLKSPKRANWDGVTVKKLNEKEIQFTLKQPYSPFLENATLGILPKHIWTAFDSDQFPFSLFNIEPIGSGPYKINKIKRDSYGIPAYYGLVSFSKYIFGKPYIKKIDISFFSNEKMMMEAFKGGEIESMNTISSQNAELLKKENDLQIIRTPLPRIFGIFFNQSQASVFSNKEVRDALNNSIDKERIVREVLNGYGIEIDSPIPPDLMEEKIIQTNEKEPGKEDGASRTENALKLLQDSGWTMNEKENILEKKMKKDTVQLRFSISTSNTPELKKAAEIIKEEWEKLGAKVDVKVFESGDLNQNVIRPRKYDALLFGEIVGRDLDLFAFWHSSQLKDPGLNIALYANSKIDKLLEDARKIEDKKERIEKYKQFESEIKKDAPAVFLYSPDFIYVVPKKVRGYSIDQVVMPAERFLNVNKWFVETERVWKIFAGDRKQ